MGKIETLSEYIERCDEHRYNDAEKCNFIEEVRSVYGEEIKGFEYGLETYCESVINSPDYIDFDEDIYRVKAKLMNYKDNLEAQYRKEELERLKLQTSIQISNNMESNQNQTINIGELTREAITAAEQLPEELLTREECLRIKAILSELECETEKKKTEQAKKKLYELVIFLTGKGIDVLVALMPYLGSMARGIFH